MLLALQLPGAPSQLEKSTVTVCHWPSPFNENDFSTVAPVVSSPSSFNRYPYCPAFAPWSDQISKVTDLPSIADADTGFQNCKILH